MSIRKSSPKKRNKVKLNCDLLDDLLFIEGDKPTLLFLSEMIIKHINQKEVCGLQMSPKGAGKAFFKRKSKYGLYIHLLPCEHS